jgi:pimeloyl-ACP methyl ester carboxylesterase
MSETPESEQTPARPDAHQLPADSVPGEQPGEQPELLAQPSAAQSPTPQPRESAASTRAAKASTPTTASQRGTARSIHYNLSYIVANEASGPRGAIVLLHDLPGGAFVWDSVLPTLAATGHAVYAFDLLGYGRSDHPWPSDSSIWGHADALLYAFQGLRLSQITLVGIGLGAAVAQVLANRLFRENIAKLALINSYAFETAFAPNWPLPEMAKHQDPEAPHHANIEDVLNDLRKTLPLGSASPSAITSDRIAAYVDEWNSNVGKQMLYQHVRLMNPNYMNSVASDNAKLTVPVLLLWGELDNVTPPALGERLRDEIPAAHFVTVANAGHLLLEDAPAEVGRQLAEFVG